MKHLTTLTPPQILILIERNDLRLKDLLQFTFFDLICKGVLTVTTEERQPNPRDPITTYQYVELGSNYGSYTEHGYENVFLAPFKGDTDIRFFVTHAIHAAFERAVDYNAFKARIVRSFQPAGYFKRSFWSATYSLTDMGEDALHEVEMELMNLEDELPALLKNEPAKAKELIKQVGANAFLVTTLDSEQIKQLQRLFQLGEGAFADSRDNSGCSTGCSGCSTWGDSWNSDSDGGCSASGCSSGDSGCSGGGCGGD